MLTAQQTTQLQALEQAQYKLSDIVDYLEANNAMNAKLLELAQNMQTEMDFAMMLIEDWS